jgi:hypothetical protein
VNNKLDTQLVPIFDLELVSTGLEDSDYMESNLLIMRDPSLRAYAQDDMWFCTMRGGKNGGAAAILSSPSSPYRECHPERSEGSLQKITHINNTLSVKYENIKT